MIYTLTLNPALDYIVRLPAIREGQTNRAVSTELQFGGKGVNVSLVLAELGIPSVALGFAAGFTGAALTAYLAERGIHADFIPLPEGLTRINIKLKTPEGAHPETEINAAGPAIPNECLQALLAKLDTLTEGDTLVLGPFQGKPACIRIPVGRGVCGTAVAEDAVQLVYDVHQFPGHIACDCASNSEIVVPIHVGGKIWGVLDIDSPFIGRFSDEDKTGLEEFVKTLEKVL